MMKRLVLVVLMAGLGVLAFPARAQEPSNPYIYYYSDDLNVFIIERADGTDTRMLGEGLMTLDDDSQNIHVMGPGWSPSGKWFAWTAAQSWIYGYPYSGNRPYILSADGSQRLTLLDHLENAQLAWAKDEDILFVASREFEQINPGNPEDDRGLVDTYLAAIDVDSGTIVSVYENQTPVHYFLRDEYIRPTVIQTADGEHVIVSYVEPGSGEDYGFYDGVVTLVVLDTDGTIVEKRLDDFEGRALNDTLSLFPSISPAGWVVYPIEDGFRVENVLTDEQHTFEVFSYSQQIHWDTSGQYAMLTNEDVWWLDCSTGALTRILESVKLDYSLHYHYSPPIWSPDGNYALFLGNDTLLYAFNVATGKLTQLLIDPVANNAKVAWYWFDDVHPVIYHTAEPGIVIYDLASFTVQRIEIDLSRSQSPRLSSDGRYVASVYDGAVIYDAVTGTSLKLRPDYHSLASSPGGEIVWNDTEDWLLIFEDGLVAGSGGMRHLRVARIDGSYHRDLSYSRWPTSITLDWLPPQVDVADLPPPIMEPLSPLRPASILQGTEWSFYMDWSPNGNWIAAGLDRTFEGSIFVWDVTTGEIIHVFEDVPEDERVVWPEGDEYVPKLAVPSNDPRIAISPDGRQVMQGKQVINAESGEVLVDLLGDRYAHFWSASFSPDGYYLAAADPFTHVFLWDTTTWELVALVPNPGGAVAFSPEGTQLAVTASWDVQIWNVADLIAAGVPEWEPLQ